MGDAGVSSRHGATAQRKPVYVEFVAPLRRGVSFLRKSKTGYHGLNDSGQFLINVRTISKLTNTD